MKKESKSIKELIEELPENTGDAVNQVVKYVNEHPDEARSILLTILNKKGVSNDVFKDASIKMSKEDSISSKAIVDAVKESDVVVPDNMISGILHEGKFETEMAGQLIDQINDEKVKQQNIIRALTRIYCKCGNYSSDELLIEALNNIGIDGKKHEKNDEIEMWIRKIISKKMAINFNKYGFSKVFVFSNYYSPEQMIEMNFSKDVISEYDKLKSERNAIEESDVTNTILEAISTNVAKNYQETGRYIIPQIKNLNNISEEEEEKFIHNIASKSKRKLSESEIRNIKSQIGGKARNEENDESVFNQLVDSGIVDLMEGLSDEERNGAIKVIKESLERSILKRKEKVEDDEKVK